MSTGVQLEAKPSTAIRAENGTVDPGTLFSCTILARLGAPRNAEVSGSNPLVGFSPVTGRDQVGDPDPCGVIGAAGVGAGPDGVCGASSTRIRGTPSMVEV